MNVIRSTPYTLVPNDAIRDPRLSLRAKGLLALMLSRPDDEPYDLIDLREFSQDDPEAAFRELSEAGYVTRDASGDYTVTGLVRGA